MSEFITDRDLSSIGETNMAAYAGLTITDGGVCFQRTELPQAVTVAGALSNEGDEITADEAQSLTFEELKKKLGVSDADNVGSSFLSETRFDPRTDTGLSLDELKNVYADEAQSLTFEELKKKLGVSGVITMGVSGAYTRCDFQPNGISDVIFLESGSQHRVGYWLDGTNDWVAETSLAFDWDVLGGYDMNSDHRADLLVYNVSGGSATIGYYESGDMSQWQTLGTRNVTDTDWDMKVGNLTGNTGKNSLVWHDKSSGTLDVWTDGTTSSTTLGSYAGSSGWAMQGCGDFDGDGKDSVLMTQNGGHFYSVDLDGPQTSLGDLNWSGWEVRAIGDFASMVGNVYTVGDGKDDVVLFHEETGAMVKLVNGNANNYESIGQLAAGDWFMAGCGDYNGDQKDDLLVRQYSTGMLGYYSEGIQDTAHWNNMGYGVDMNWTVIA